MTGKAEVKRLQNVLDATFARATKVGSDPELQSDVARYLCVLVSGFLEKAVAELLIEHARRRGGPTLVRYVEINFRRATNMKTGRLRSLLDSFDVRWSAEFDGLLTDQAKDAIESIVALRNKIAHGESVGVTLTRVKGYYEEIKPIVTRIGAVCCP